MESEKERARNKERVRKAREGMVSILNNGVGSITGRKHAANEAKRGHTLKNSHADDLGTTSGGRILRQLRLQPWP